MQQPKLYSNLTFRKHGLIQLSLLSLLLHYATHHCLPLTALFHLFSFISLSYSCHISSAPNLFLSISFLLYFSLLLCLVMYLFLMVTLLHSISLYIRCGWVESKVNRSFLNPSRSQSSSPLPKQTLKPIKELILFSVEGHCSRWILYISVTDPLRVSLLSTLFLSLLTVGSAHDWYSSVAKQTKRDKSKIIVCGRDKVIMRKCIRGNWSFFRKLSDLLGMPIITSCVSYR